MQTSGRRTTNVHPGRLRTPRRDPQEPEYSERHNFHSGMKQTPPNTHPSQLYIPRICMTTHVQGLNFIFPLLYHKIHQFASLKS